MAGYIKKDYRLDVVTCLDILWATDASRYVVKRSGEKQEVRFDAITQRLRPLCEGLDGKHLGLTHILTTSNQRMHAFMHGCMDGCIHVRMCVCRYVCRWAGGWVGMCVCMQIWLHVCMHACMVGRSGVGSQVMSGGWVGR